MWLLLLPTGSFRTNFQDSNSENLSENGHEEKVIDTFSCITILLQSMKMAPWQP